MPPGSPTVHIASYGLILFPHLTPTGTYVGFAPDNDGQWRTSLGIQIIPAVVLACLILFFPESPRWLIDHGRPEEGLRILAKLHAHGDINDAWVRAEFDQIQEAITFEHEHEAQSYVELFKDRSCFRRLFIACALQASVQMTGVSAIQYYSVTIYGLMGIKDDETLKYQAISSVIALIAHFLVWSWRPWLPGPKGYASLISDTVVAAYGMLPFVG